jgi:hypothetical protein
VHRAHTIVTIAMAQILFEGAKVSLLQGAKRQVMET